MGLRVEGESCHWCGHHGTCWWSFPPPWRLCAECHEYHTGEAVA